MARFIVQSSKIGRAFSFRAALSDVAPNPNLITVPNFVGVNYATQNVYNQIINLGLTVGSVTENPVYEETLMSLVTSQSLVAGSQVSPGTSISLNRNQDFVSGIVPNLIGLTQAQAEAAIVSAGLSPSVGNNVSLDATPENTGTVASQFPSPGTIASLGAVVIYEPYYYVAPPPSSNLVVFDQSTGPNSTVTGGWNSYITGGYGSPVVSTENGQLTVSAPFWQDAQVEPNNDIVLSGATSITLVVSSFSNEPWYYYSNFSYPQADGQYAGVAIANPSDYNFTNRTVTIPLTNPANGKLRLSVTNSGNSAGDGWTRLHSIVVNY
jgi:hypothetical protein